MSAIYLNKPEDLSKANSQAVFDRVYQTGLTGQGAWHSHHSAGSGYEDNKHSFQQHVIFVHLQPEAGSLRGL